MAGPSLKVITSNTLRLKFYFNKECADTVPIDRSALKEAIKSDDIKGVFSLISAGFDADLPVDPIWDHTPLILATCYGAYRVLPLLLKVSKQKDATNYEGHTALDKAIIYYSLACQHFHHKPFELEKRYTILKSLIRAGCQKVKVPDIELWVKENKRDTRFLRNIVNVLCLSPSYDLKCIGLATLIRLNTELFYIRQILRSGAGFKYLKNTFHGIAGPIFEFPEVLSDMLAEILIKSTNNPFIHHQVINVKIKEARKRDKCTALLKEHLLQLLSQVDFSPSTECTGLLAMIHDLFNRSPRKPKDLKHLCRSAIRVRLRPNVIFGVKHLPLPATVKDFITLDALDVN